MSNKIAEMNKRVSNHISGVKSSVASLKALSRDMLTYVPETNDAPAATRLVEGESPAVQRKLRQFFATFIGWEFNPEKERYGKKHPKQKVVDNKLAKAQEALKDPDFNFWTWYEKDGEKPEKKPKDHKKAVGNAIKAALTEEGDNKMSVTDVATVLFAQGVDMRVLMKAAENYAAIQQMES